MSTQYTTCDKCGAELVIDDGDCYAGGLRDYEKVYCPTCNNEVASVYTSGIPYVHYASSNKKK